MGIYVAGSVTHDTVFGFPGLLSDQLITQGLDHINVTYKATSLRRSIGGCGTNIAYALKLIGERPLLVAAVGENDLAYFKRHFEQLQIDTALSALAQVESDQCSILTDHDGHQLASFCACASEKAPASFWPEAFPVELAILAPEASSTTIRRIRTLLDHHVPFVFDPGQTLPNFSESELAQCIEQARWMVVSDYELELVHGVAGLDVGRVLQSCEALVVTHAARGSSVFTREGRLDVPACRATLVDAVGAGDAFRCGLLHALRRGLDWLQALRLGSAVAAFKVECKGTEDFCPSLREIQERIEENYADYSDYRLG